MIRTNDTSKTPALTRILIRDMGGSATSSFRILSCLFAFLAAAMACHMHVRSHSKFTNDLATNRVMLRAQDLHLVLFDNFQYLWLRRSRGKSWVASVHRYCRVEEYGWGRLNVHEYHFLLHFSQHGVGNTICALPGTRHMERLGTLALGALYRCSMCLWSPFTAR